MQLRQGCRPRSISQMHPCRTISPAPPRACNSIRRTLAHRTRRQAARSRSHRRRHIPKAAVSAVSVRPVVCPERVVVLPLSSTVCCSVCAVRPLCPVCLGSPPSTWTTSRPCTVKHCVATQPAGQGPSSGTTRGRRRLRRRMTFKAIQKHLAAPRPEARRSKRRQELDTSKDLAPSKVLRTGDPQRASIKFGRNPAKSSCSCCALAAAMAARLCLASSSAWSDSQTFSKKECQSLSASPGS